MAKQRRLQDRLVAALVKRGAQRTISQPSRKFIRLTADAPDRYWWVGKSGALRLGRTNADSHSMSGTKVYKELVNSEPE